MIVKQKNALGITLIALIITIVVMLILAAVALIGTLGETGIIKNVIKIKEENQYKTAEEKVILAVNFSYGEDGKLNKQLLKESINQIVNIENQLQEVVFPLIIQVDGYEFEITELGEIIGKRKTDDEKPKEEIIIGQKVLEYPIITQTGVANCAKYTNFDNMIYYYDSSSSCTAIDALPEKVYDLDENTYYITDKITKESYYMQVDESAQECYMRVKKFSYNNENYVDEITFLDENKNIISKMDKEYQLFDGYVMIPKNTRWILYFSDVHSSLLTIAHTNRIYDIQIRNEPLISYENVYPILSATKAKIPETTQVSLTYFKTSVKKLYKIGNEEEWKEYKENEVIDVKIGEILYAKGIDKDGNETRIISNHTPKIAEDIIGELAYDGNDETCFKKIVSGTINCYMKVDESIIGKKVRIKQYIFNNGNWYSDIRFLNDKKEVISTIQRKSGTTDEQYVVPENTKWILFTAYGITGKDESYRSKIYTIEPVI